MIASVRHVDTPHDRPLMSGVSQADARHQVPDQVSDVVDSWKISHGAVRPGPATPSSANPTTALFLLEFVTAKMLGHRQFRMPSEGRMGIGLQWARGFACSCGRVRPGSAASSIKPTSRLTRVPTVSR